MLVWFEEMGRKWSGFHHSQPVEISDLIFSAERIMPRKASF
jgi:hypothetical protein